MSKLLAKPVMLITGFLGAGKTTFLNALIQYQHNQRLAIIENEFGEEPIDGELIIGADNDIYELSNGCLCCSLNQDFYVLLEELWGRRNEFDELVIETTGIADPASVASPFLTSQSISCYYQLKRVVCLIDARHIEEQLKNTVEARKQISFSDILLITKTDLIEDNYLPYLENLLDEINPFAQMLSGNKTQYPFAELFAIERHAIVKKRPKFSLAPVPVKHHQHDDLVSLSFTFTEPFSISLLQHQLTAFLIFQAKDVYRVKGIIYVEAHSRKIIVQSVNANLVVEYGEEWQDDELKQSRIVFIGKQLKPAGFERMLKLCLIA
ncbi:GTP-binding protein [Mucilaginibacter robiniae]|uniref:GTP-binding protein n=1 Tax=Mucilaginibacter robiniae TaxID=2728022 RepID=A0A7L5DZB9_9SPHI|nr:GTP-binding protein [Mucilaginibacter robiniae]QJD95457.1 GTP-binding protein [Mucilaginibacter robiniae]